MATTKKKTEKDDDFVSKIRQLSVLGQRAGNNIPAPIPNDPMTTTREPGYPSPVKTSPTFPSSGGGALPRIGSNYDMEEADILDSMYHPETKETDRFSKFLDEYPDHENQSIVRRLVASGIGLKHGYKSAQDVMEEPFNKKLTDWKEKAGPYQQSANLERFANVNARTMYGQLATNAAANRRIGETERANKAREEETTRKNQATEDIARTRNEINDYRAKHPQARWDVSGTTIKLLNDDETVTDTHLPTSHLTEMQKIEMGQKNALARIAATGDETRETNAAKPPTGTATKPGDTLQQKMEVIYASDEEARKWMKKQGTTFIWSPPTSRKPEDLYRYQQIRHKYDPEFKITATDPMSDFTPNPAARGGRTSDIDLPREGGPEIMYGTQKSTGKPVESHDGGKTWQLSGGR